MIEPLNKDEKHFIREQGHRQVNALAKVEAPEFSDPLFSMVAKAEGKDSYTPVEWAAVLDKLENEKRPLEKWAQDQGFDF